jgi:haloalkane dehalogenase
MTAWADRKSSVPVLDLSMAYIDSGQGQPIVLLHGNPTSSFLWRTVISELDGLARCVAPDLPGMGDSAKMAHSGPGSYRLADHQPYVDAFIERMAFDEPIVLVLHDWGSALGFDWARRNPDRVAGIAYMEAVVCPMTMKEWPAAKVFSGLRSAAGEEMVLEKNVFVEVVLPRSILRTLTDEEMAEYRRPYVEVGEGRRPTLSWPREMPLDGEPADVVEVVKQYGEFLRTSPVPKLFVNAEPGAILTGRMRDFCRTWPNQEEVTVPGIHFIQEDSGTEIAAAIAAWLKTIQ